MGFNWIYDKTARLWELVPRMSFAEVQKIIGADEEETRSDNGPGMQGVCRSVYVEEEAEKTKRLIKD